MKKRVKKFGALKNTCTFASPLKQKGFITEAMQVKGSIK